MNQIDYYQNLMTKLTVKLYCQDKKKCRDQNSVFIIILLETSLVYLREKKKTRLPKTN